jgi:DNA-binding transcriptional ArsR family regulator
LRIVLVLLEAGPSRPTRLARLVGLPSSTAMYQLRVLKQAGLLVQGDDAGSTMVRLADQQRVLGLLRAYHPAPDALSEFAELWARAFQAFAPATPIDLAPVAEEPSKVELPTQLEGQPSSVHQVYSALLAGPMTGKDLCLETGLARRTVYTALQALRGLGLLKERGHLGDMRQQKFWVDAPSSE